jgi:26S proteasome regulatory subunit N2
MVGLVSAAGLVGFLSEPDPDLKVFALRTLDAEVNLLWTEIVDAIPLMYVILSWRRSWAFFLHI